MKEILELSKKRATPRIVSILILASSLAWAVPRCNSGTEEESSPLIERSDHAPGFDPTPVQLPVVTKAAPRAITSMNLLNLRDLKGVQISPDGKSVAFVVQEAMYESNSYRTGLFVVGTEPGSRIISLGSAGPPRWDMINQSMSDPTAWSPDSRYIARRLRRGGTWQVWRWSRDGGEPVQITHAVRDVESFKWSSDGRYIIFETREPQNPNAYRNLSEHGILFDGSIGGNFVGNRRPFVEQLLESVDFDWALGKERQPKMETWVCELASGKEILGIPAGIGTHARWDVNADSPVDIYDPQKPDVPRARTSLAISRARISPDGKLLAYRWQPPWDELPIHPSRYTSLFVRPAEGGKELDLAPGFWSIGEFWWGADGGEVYFWGRLFDNIPSNLYVVLSHGGTPREVAHMDASFRASSVDANVTLVAGVKETTTIPNEVAVVDLKSGDVRTLANVNPEFANIRLSPAMQINWKNKYGDTRYGYLFKPLDYKPGEKYPLIITTYANGPEAFRRGAVGDEYPIQVFTAKGFAVLDVELVPFYGFKPGDFESFLWRYYASIADFEAAIKIVVDMGIVDPSRKGISGLSYGARITSFAISHSDLFQAAIVSGPNGDDPFCYYLDDPFQMKVQFGPGGLEWPEGQTSEKWHRLSPALNAARVKAPMLVNSADSELLAGMQFYTSLLQLGKAIEVFIYPDEEHEKNQPKHRYEIYQRNVDWFDFWLNGHEDADPAKAEQYKRWRKLQKMQQENEGKLAEHLP